MSDPRHLPALIRLHPKGAHNTEDGSRVRELLATLAQPLDDHEDQAALLRAESRPQSTTAAGLLERWEELYGLVPGSADEATRQARLIAAVRRVPDCKPATLLELAETWSSMDWDLVEPMSFRFDDPDSLFDEAYDLLGPFAWLLVGDHDTAEAAGLNRAKLLSFMNSAKPAHTVLALWIEGNFLFDDELSTLDTDFFGE